MAKAKSKAKKSKRPAVKKRASAVSTAKKKGKKNAKPTRQTKPAAGRSAGSRANVRSSTRGNRRAPPKRDTRKPDKRRQKKSNANRTRVSARRSKENRRKLSEIARLREIIRNQAAIIRAGQTRKRTKNKLKELVKPKGAKDIKNKKGKVIGFELPPYIGPIFGKTEFGSGVYTSMLKAVGQETEDFYGQADGTEELENDDNSEDNDNEEN